MSNSVAINWTGVGHDIEGFGVFAGRADPFFTDKNRDELLDKLFSTEYLGLNMIRAKVLDTFSKADGDINFHLDANIDVKPGDPDYPVANSDDMEQRGQLWILKKALARYPNIDKIMATVWSPPIYMKAIHTESGYLNILANGYEDKFADYLAQFAKQFTAAGIPIYALSAMNEPESVTVAWDGCCWEPLAVPAMLSKLKSALIANNLSTKVISSENANWTTTNIYLSTILGICDMSYREPYPVDILGSHGYTGPTNHPGDINVDPYNWHLINNTMPRWITESCSAVDGNLGMEMGLKLAESMHNFVYNQQVSAYIYWLGVVKDSNESLINSDGTTYSLNKTYDVLGNFSRYIKPGFKTISASTDQPVANVLCSAYKSADDKDFSCVLINKNATSSQVTLSVNHTLGDLTPYVTTADSNVRWQPAEAISANPQGEYLITLPQNSVTTLTTLVS